MKTMFVTVAEFLENGGKLIKDGGLRKVYYQNGMEVRVYGEDLYKSIIEMDPDNYFVQIKCTPLYQ